MGTVDTGLAPPVAHIYRPPVDKAVGEVVESLESEASLTVEVEDIEERAWDW